MKALEYRGLRDLAWVDVVSAQLAADGDAVVRPLATATCDLDWQIIAGQTPFPPPFILGHEFVGEVVAVGNQVTRFTPGDLVTVAFQPSCGVCGSCGRGESAACGSVAPTSMFGVGSVSGNWGGAFAELVGVPYADNMLAAAAAGWPLAALPSINDNIADAHRTVAPYVGPTTNSQVCIFGGYDSVPLYAAAFALALGATKVTYCTKDQRAADNAQRLGAEVNLVTEWPKRLAACDVTVCAAQSSAALAAAIRSTRAGGHCTSAAIFMQDIAMPLREMYMRGIHVHTGRVNGAETNRAAAQWITSGLIEPLMIDTEVVTFDALIPALLNRSTAKLVAVPE
jgi:threonine dehydrogenase-like Zn-dependent dehydrogenase